MKRWLLPALVGLAVLIAAAGALTARADSGGHGKSKDPSTYSCSSSSTPNSWKKVHCMSSGKDSEHHQSGDDDNTTTTTTSSSGSSSQSSQLCGLDVEWLKTSIEGDLFEIQGGQLALKKSENQAVRDLAQRLITDHTQSLQDATGLAQKYGVPVPTEPSPTEQWELEELGEMQGAEFNHDYTELEIKDHEQDIDETSDEVEMGCNPEVKDEANKDLPMLQMHLQLSRQAHQAAGPERPASSTSSPSNG
jgi:putative membrane protein